MEEYMFHRFSYLSKAQKHQQIIYYAYEIKAKIAEINHYCEQKNTQELWKIRRSELFQIYNNTYRSS